MKHLSILLLFFVAISLQTNAQLTVADDNNVGIGSSATEPKNLLSVGSNGDDYSSLYVINSTTSGSQRAAKFYKSASGSSGNPFSFAINSTIAADNGGSKLVGGYFYAYSSTQTSNYRYGIYSIAGNGTTNCNYGVWARLAGSKNGAALFATTGTNYEKNTGGQYAGYFRGDVLMEDDLEVQGTLNETSDISLKKDIRPLRHEEVKQVENLRTLTPIRYKLKNPVEQNSFSSTEIDTMSVKPRDRAYDSRKYTQERIGLSAQEIQLVYPELVKENSQGYLSVNYTGFIPVIIEATRELDEATKNQDATIKIQNGLIQEQAEALRLLNSEMGLLKNQVSSMKDEIATLKAEIEALKNPEQAN